MSQSAKYAGEPDRQVINLLDADIERFTLRLMELARILQEVDRMRENQRNFFAYRLERYKKQSIVNEKKVDQYLAQLKREKFIEDPPKPGKQTEIFG